MTSHHPHHHHHHHHHHHKNSVTPHEGGASDQFASDFLLSENRDFSGSYFGSLGRPNFHRTTNSYLPNQRTQLTLSESEPEVWPLKPEIWPQTTSSNTGLTGLHPPPVKTARLSADVASTAKRGPTARRYGSIRVAECSFIEAEGGSQASTPSASICEIDTPSTVYARPSTYRQHRQQYSYAAGLRSPGQNSLPPPPTPPPHEGGATSLCNGPMSLALSDFRSASNIAATNREGPNGQHSHIIPPPQNFSSNGEYAPLTPLTTTRIGTSMNLTSRPRPPPTSTEAGSYLWPHQKFRGQNRGQNETRTDSY